MKQPMHLFSAHHADKNFLSMNCDHYYCEVLSVASFIDSPECTSEPYRHKHDAYEFLIPYGPIPLLLYEDTVHFGETGYVHPVHSGKEHGFKSLITNISYDNIVVDKDFLEEIMRQKQYINKEFNYSFKLTQEQKTYIRLFKSEFDSEHACGKDKLHHLAALIITSFIESAFSNEKTDTLDFPHYQQGILQVAAYINQHYTESLNLENLADMCHLSKTYFISAFKKVIGETPYSYLLHLRIAKAEILLETTDYTIKEIATMCGFKRTNTFTSHFRTVTHMTPSEYRENIRN